MLKIITILFLLFGVLSALAVCLFMLKIPLTAAVIVIGVVFVVFLLIHGFLSYRKMQFEHIHNLIKCDVLPTGHALIQRRSDDQLVSNTMSRELVRAQ